jgi:hypothetical protein
MEIMAKRVKKQLFETLNWQPEDIPMVKEALLNTQRITRMTNNSIFPKEDGNVEVWPTHASYLIQFGSSIVKC